TRVRPRGGGPGRRWVLVALLPARALAANHAYTVARGRTQLHIGGAEREHGGAAGDERYATVVAATARLHGGGALRGRRGGRRDRGGPDRGCGAHRPGAGLAGHDRAVAGANLGHKR